ELLSRLPELGDELVETGRSQDEQRPAGAGLRDAETVRHVSRQKHQRSRTGLPGPLATEPFEQPLEDVEGLVGAPVDMWRWRVSCRASVVQDGEPAPGVDALDLADGQ